MQNYVHHRDEKLFPCPDEFVAQRWLATNSIVGDMNAALTPFSVGTRNCIGQNLARADLFLVTSKIFRKLRVCLSSQMTEDDMEMQDRFAVHPKAGRLLLDLEVLEESKE